MHRATAPASYKSPPHEMPQATPSCLWNDSASIQEVTYSMEHGAVGATCNPVIVHGVLKKEMSLWKERILALIEELPTATEDAIAWQLVREVSVKGANLLRPVFEAQGGRNGRLSIQTDPRLYRDTKAIVQQVKESIKASTQPFARSEWCCATILISPISSKGWSGKGIASPRQWRATDERRLRVRPACPPFRRPPRPCTR